MRGVSRGQNDTSEATNKLQVVGKAPRLGLLCVGEHVAFNDESGISVCHSRFLCFIKCE